MSEKNSSLLFSLIFELQNDVTRKPAGEVKLDERCRITRADGAATFEITSGRKTLYLTADSIAQMEDWLRVLSNVQRQQAAITALSREEQRPTLQGWLIKVKNGHPRKCFCVLVGKRFLYYNSPTDKVWFFFWLLVLVFIGVLESGW